VARAGDELEIPMAGRVVFRRTRDETDGELMEFDFFLPVGHESAQEHLHPKQEERFEVVSGKVRGQIGGEEQVRETGETAVMPAGVRHFWWNDGDEVAHLRVEVRPALRTEEFYETMAGLAVGEEGIPNRMHAAVVMREFKDEMVIGMFSSAPAKALITTMAAIGRMRGLKAEPPAEDGK
jgi:quercetin dioxygenase-like cupin family protein